MSYPLELAKGTDVGRTRNSNEDCVGVDAEQGVFVLADGMGGHNAGEIASAMAVDFLLKGLADIRQQLNRDQDGWQQATLSAVKQLVIECNQQIYQAGQRESRMHGMGTTLVAGFVSEQQLFYVHVGDSRLYRLRQHQFVQLTEDHTLLQEVKSGSMNSEVGYETTIPGNIVTRALGAAEEVKPDTAFSDVEPGDLFLSCSDGLTDRLNDAAIQALVEKSSSLPGTVKKLIDQANQAGGEDNISVILLSIKPPTLLDGFKRILRK